MSRLSRILALALLAWPWASLQAAPGQEGLLPVAEAFALQVRSPGHGQVWLEWRIAPSYYLYRERIQLKVVEGEVPVPALQLPEGIAKEDPYFGPVQIYRDQLQAHLRLDPAQNPVRLRIVVQGCHEVEPLVCYPPHARTLRVDDTGAHLEPLSGAAVAAADSADVAVQAEPAPAPAQAASEPAPAQPLAIVGILLSALLGGLLLNLMPCVLPVLSLKLLSLAEAGADVAQARRRALAYTAGVMSSFAAIGTLVLAIRAAGVGLGWGFQLQQPLVVSILAYVMLALGLALSGVVLFATRLGGVGHGLASREGLAGDFFTGVLAVVVASPCTAPFMGVALAAAFTLHAAIALLVFLALGLGLALPFLLVAWVPALSSRLPRPGAWMDTLKQALAFPLYATAAWLAWVLARQHGSDALGWLFVGALVLALGLWASERLRYARWSALRPLALVLALSSLWPLWHIHHLPAPTADGAQLVSSDGSVPFDPEHLEALRAQERTVFVNMTADWCVTCKANERRLLATADFRELLQERDAVYLKGDWTRMDPRITRFLEQHGAVGVPLYVVFRPGQAQGAVLSTVPTQTQVRAALAGEPI
jgi:thiol:disulfide interchange protein